ncbi:hypothetical protein [Kitasatospora paracochleata]|uniref:Uncharacterized protein n=1 Tax=Kitasatospora paracochleata TaxID=58354 RepID=A0ABT1JB19_9ACTN|nr:hypothetical protein [Kitasatospora paracochleata]MCP2314637.1 hypothetical protein [Kitasatospora paracochleata]
MRATPRVRRALFGEGACGVARDPAHAALPRSPQAAESRRLERAERDAVLVVVAHPSWETLPFEDRVDAHMQLKYIDDPAHAGGGR